MILFVFYLAKQIILMLFYLFKAVFTFLVKVIFKMLDICVFLLYCLYKKIKKELKKNDEAKLLKIAGQSDIFET